MRDYKFRGKTKNGEWVYGSLFLINEKSYIYERNYGDLDDIDFGRGFEEVLPETVGQFTGLLDRNGVEIYEGDVVKAKRHNFEIDDICVIVYKPISFIFEVQNKKGNYFAPRNYHQYFEVIGNTHDNSDLLEQNQ